MKKTFSKDDLTYLIPNEQMFEALIDYAKSNGVPVYNGTSVSSYKEYKRLVFTGVHICGCDTTRRLNPITIDQFIEYCDNWMELKGRNLLQLNEQYTAEINRENKEVKVGCQTIPFEKIDELHKLIHEQ